jgi:hypothetical protein
MTLRTRQAPQQKDGLQNILSGMPMPSDGRDDEIRERVRIPVDDRLGGCRGFKSHRPHHDNAEFFGPEMSGPFSYLFDDVVHESFGEQSLDHRRASAV